MSLLFKMQKTQITFSLALILKARILYISKLSRYAKGYLISQNFIRMRRDWKNKNSHVNSLITFMFTGLLFITDDTKKI